MRIEFVPPGGWKTLWVKTWGTEWGAGVFWVWRHWGFGPELFPVGGGGLMFGPIMFVCTKLQAVR